VISDGAGTAPAVKSHVREISLDRSLFGGAAFARNRPPLAIFKPSAFDDFHAAARSWPRSHGLNLRAPT
jgi:hypothetical protein